MDPDEPPRRDALRMSATGDVEIFDGTVWRAVSSLLKNPATGNREEPRGARPDGSADLPEPGSQGSGVDPAGEPEQD